jgi:hypothetical protein
VIVGRGSWLDGVVGQDEDPARVDAVGVGQASAVWLAAAGIGFE